MNLHAIDIAIIFGMMFFKGVLASLAGPAPNYDMQRVLATRNPREACMMNGIISAMFVPELAVRLVGHDINPLYTFPVIFSISVVGCLVGTFLTKPEDDAILKHFYKTVNPWGAWGPIRDKVMREDPAFQPNRSCGRDCANVMVGIVWQLCLTALPIYLVLRQWSWVGAIAATLGVTSLIIKFNWYDKLEQAPGGIVSREQPLPTQTTS